MLELVMRFPKAQAWNARKRRRRCTLIMNMLLGLSRRWNIAYGKTLENSDKTNTRGCSKHDIWIQQRLECEIDSKNWQCCEITMVGTIGVIFFTRCSWLNRLRAIKRWCRQNGCRVITRWYDFRRMYIIKFSGIKLKMREKLCHTI